MRTYPSPFMTVLLTIGIITLGVLPPVGVIIIVIAILVQRQHTKGLRGAHGQRIARAQQAEHKAAVRYFS